MSFIPYTTTYDRDDNAVYWFKYKGNEKEPYDIRIVIDELNDDLVVNKTCTCPAFLKFQQGKDCKHITQALQILNSFLVIYRGT